MSAQSEADAREVKRKADEAAEAARKHPHAQSDAEAKRVAEEARLKQEAEAKAKAKADEEALAAKKKADEAAGFAAKNLPLGSPEQRAAAARAAEADEAARKQFPATQPSGVAAVLARDAAEKAVDVRDFKWAMAQLKAGKNVRRRPWGVGTAPYFLRTKDGKTVISGIAHSDVAWTEGGANDVEKDAKDWEVVE